jgi:two-component system chemotaxis response regulator CheY
MRRVRHWPERRLRATLRDGRAVAMKKILLVDDDQIVRSVFTHLLGGEWEIVQAADGEEAWELLLAGTRPAVCCSDVIMPRLDGLGLLRRTRAHPAFKYLPFVFMTSAPDADSVGTAAEMGASAFIVKPFLRAQAPGAIQAALREDRDSRGEHYLMTIRRLNVGLDEVEARLRKLHLEALALLQEADRTAPAQVRKLRALAAASRDLGLRRCASLAEDAAERPLAEADRRRVLQEAVDLIQDQLGEIASLG